MHFMLFFSVFSAELIICCPGEASRSAIFSDLPLTMQVETQNFASLPIHYEQFSVALFQQNLR
jgi:hypothetical protein